MENLKDKLHELKIVNEKYGHSVFLDGNKIRTCTALKLEISVDECQGEIATVKLEFLATVDAEVKALVEAGIKEIKAS